MNILQIEKSSNLGQIDETTEFLDLDVSFTNCNTTSAKQPIGQKNYGRRGTNARRNFENK